MLANISRLTRDLVVHGCVGGWLTVTFPGGARRMLEPFILKQGYIFCSYQLLWSSLEYYHSGLVPKGTWTGRRYKRSLF